MCHSWHSVAASNTPHPLFQIWYSVPATGGDALRRELTELMSGYLRQQPVWLPSDTAMVPPDLLADRG